MTNIEQRIREFTSKRRTGILLGLCCISSFGLLTAILEASKKGAMGSAVLLAVAMTALILDRRHVDRLAGTGMIMLMAFALVLIGGARFYIGDGGEAAFLEITIGIYLAAASYHLTQKR